MIIINKPEIEKLEKTSRLICEIKMDEEIKRIYFEVEKEYEKYLTYFKKQKNIFLTHIHITHHLQYMHYKNYLKPIFMDLVDMIFQHST